MDRMMSRIRIFVSSLFFGLSLVVVHLQPVEAEVIETLQKSLSADEALVARVGYYGLLWIDPGQVRFVSFDQTQLVDGKIFPASQKAEIPSQVTVSQIEVYPFEMKNVHPEIFEFFFGTPVPVSEEKFWKYFGKSGPIVAPLKTVIGNSVIAPETSASTKVAKPPSVFIKPDYKLFGGASLFNFGLGIYYSQALPATQPTLEWYWALGSAGGALLLSVPTAYLALKFLEVPWVNQMLDGEGREVLMAGPRRSLVVGSSALIVGTLVNCGLFMSNLAEKF